MAVSVSGELQSGTFVPFRTAKRGGPEGSDPVGTIYFDGGATGAAGGGTVTISVTMAKLDFGFHALFVPTFLSVQDTLVTAEEVNLIYDAAGNSRIGAGNGIVQGQLAVAGAGVNSAVFTVNGMLIEPSEETQALVLAAQWITNTDTKAYHFHVFGMLFDAEIMAREESRISELLMGVR